MHRLRDGRNHRFREIREFFPEFRFGPQERALPQGILDSTATPKQVSFLISLGARNKLTFADLQRIAQERFQVGDLYSLPKQAASQLIDEMKPAGSTR